MSNDGQPGALVAEVLGAVDAGDLDGFARWIAEDGELRFGNADPVVGRSVIRAAIGESLSHFRGIRHDVRGAWGFQDVIVAEVLVTYLRDHDSVSIPATTIWDMTRDGQIGSYRVYIDQGALAAQDGSPARGETA
jgi:ketosteroid isomerase-like protein